MYLRQNCIDLGQNLMSKKKNVFLQLRNIFVSAGQGFGMGTDSLSGSSKALFLFLEGVFKIFCKHYLLTLSPVPELRKKIISHLKKPNL